MKNCFTKSCHLPALQILMSRFLRNWSRLRLRWQLVARTRGFDVKLAWLPRFPWRLHKALCWVFCRLCLKTKVLVFAGGQVPYDASSSIHLASTIDLGLVTLDPFDLLTNAKKPPDHINMAMLVLPKRVLLVLGWLIPGLGLPPSLGWRIGSVQFIEHWQTKGCLPGPCLGLTNQSCLLSVTGTACCWIGVGSSKSSPYRLVSRARAESG